MNRNISQEDLLYEYLSIARIESQHTTRVIEEYLRSMSSLNNNIYRLLNNLNENSETIPLISRNHAQSPIPPIRERYFTNTSINNNTYTPMTTNFETGTFSDTTFPNTTFPTTTFPRTTLSNTPRSTLPNISNSRNRIANSRSIYSRRRTPRTTTRISRRYRTTSTNTTGADTLRNLLHTTLYTPTRPRPASNPDISNNTTVHIWRDISNSTDQNICPITQEELLSTDTVRRINGCGHVFHNNALVRYLRNFDHRCPICRYDITRESDIETGNLSSQNNTTTAQTIFPPEFNLDTNTNETDISGTDISGTDISGTDISGSDIIETDNRGHDISENNITYPNGNISNAFDFSFDNNFVSNLANNLTSNLADSLTTDLNNNFSDLSNVEFLSSYDISSNNFNETVNFMSNALLSGLSEAINNPDLSGNTITAEYSVFLPIPRRPHED